MANKTFISYKYSESKKLKDKIINNFPEGWERYYYGETENQKDISDLSDETIKEKLRGMISNSSTLIVIVSENMLESNYIGWELSYALKETKRSNKIQNIIGVIKKGSDGTYNWLISYSDENIRNIDSTKLPEIINKNRYNGKYQDDNLRYGQTEESTFDIWEGSFISLIEEDKFLDDMENYLVKTFETNQDLYEIWKTDC